MSIDTITISQFINAFSFSPENLEYVHDISTDKHYGIAVRGKLDYNGEKISVLGSVVLNNNGEPNYEHTETAFVASFTGEKESEKILTGSDAINAMEKLYHTVNNDGNMFKNRNDVDIDFLAT